MQFGSQAHTPSPDILAASGPTRPWLSYPLLLLTALVAIALTFCALFRVDFSHGVLVSFRHQPIWQSTETLRVTAPSPLHRRSRNADLQRLSSLTVLYSDLLNSDAVRKLVLRGGPINGRYEARASDPSGAASRRSSRFLTIQALANSPFDAAQTASRVSHTSRVYIAQAQNAARVPRSMRLRLGAVPASGKATLVRGRHLTAPLTALGAVLVLLSLAAVARNKERLSR